VVVVTVAVIVLVRLDRLSTIGVSVVADYGHTHPQGAEPPAEVSPAEE
jgi:hypothetical protein